MGEQQGGEAPGNAGLSYDSRSQRSTEVVILVPPSISSGAGVPAASTSTLFPQHRSTCHLLRHASTRMALGFKWCPSHMHGGPHACPSGLSVELPEPH